MNRTRRQFISKCAAFVAGCAIAFKVEALLDKDCVRGLNVKQYDMVWDAKLYMGEIKWVTPDLN